uniref:Uncharacterized protein n=1 Tax=blood disease bacterium R229 TaxID=741978 RepID=G2ZQ41_9RALS|nr:hypothetical protein BDB_120218 [blood disease bacterium R229]
MTCRSSAEREKLRVSAKLMKSSSHLSSIDLCPLPRSTDGARGHPLDWRTLSPHGRLLEGHFKRWTGWRCQAASDGHPSGTARPSN